MLLPGRKMDTLTDVGGLGISIYTIHQMAQHGTFNFSFCNPDMEIADYFVNIIYVQKCPCSFSST